MAAPVELKPFRTCLERPLKSRKVSLSSITLYLFTGKITTSLICPHLSAKNCIILIMNIVILQPLAIDNSVLEEHKQNLTKKGHSVSYFDSLPENEDDVISRIKGTEVIIAVNYPISAKAINSCPTLKMISIAFTGFDHVDIETCKKKGVVVCNSAGYATHSVAELTFGLMVSVLRNIVPCNEVVRKQGTRQGLIGNELYGKTLGIIGTGEIGLRVAEIGKTFGCQLLGFNRSKKSEATKLGLKYVDLNTLLKESDIITVHTPFNKETENIIDKAEFEMMKPSAIVIQTSRGGTINESAFAEALNLGKIAGAGIDVFVQEPPVDLDSPLLKAKNTVLTPHVAFATKEALVKRAEIAFLNINEWIEGSVQNRII